MKFLRVYVFKITKHNIQNRCTFEIRHTDICEGKCFILKTQFINYPLHCVFLHGTVALTSAWQEESCVYKTPV